MIITFCFSQFTQKSLPLQPWLTIHRIALEFIANGDAVHVITDLSNASEIDGLKVHFVKSLRGTDSRELINLLQQIQPDAVVVSVTPLSLITTKWYKILKGYRSYAYISYPFYTAGEIKKAFKYLNFKERISYGRHVLIPGKIWAKSMINYFNGVICQSKKTGSNINKHTKSQIDIYLIPPGIDHGIWNIRTENFKNSKESVFLYVGKASKIRGFDLMLDAFKLIDDKQICLRILARGADEKKIREIQNKVQICNLQNRVVVKGGWMEIDEFKKELQAATAVILPFVLVPSELPVSVMEVVACGTPVVVSDIDGLAEAAGTAGIVVPQCDVHALSCAVKTLHTDKKLVNTLKRACHTEKRKMLSWNITYKLWQKILSN